jgi:hypothetical protein
MIAKVVHILEKPTSNGGIYYNLQLDVEGRKVTLNSFQSTDNATFKQAHESGGSVDITTSKNDKGYDNIDAVSLVPGTAPAEKPIPQSTTQPDRQFHADPEKQASIELQHYTSEVKDLWIAGKLTDKSPLVEKYMFILARKIGVDLNTLTPEPKITTAGDKRAGVVTPPSAPPASVTPPNALQSSSSPSKSVTPVNAQPGNSPIPKVNALSLEALNQLARDKDTFDKIKLEVKTKGWTTGKDKFTLKDLTQPQADVIIKQFSTQEDDIPF